MDAVKFLLADYVRGKHHERSKTAIEGDSLLHLYDGPIPVRIINHLPLNPERLQKLTENYVSSNAKIKKALGVDKMPVDARTGLQRTLESFKE